MSSNRWTYGSQYQLNRWLADDRPTLMRELRACCPSLDAWAKTIAFVSPDLEKAGREDADTAWGKVGLPGPSPQQAGWWPTSGPRWDAVASVLGPGGQRPRIRGSPTRGTAHR
jgi:hypothetical protein